MKKNIPVQDKALIERMNASLKGPKGTDSGAQGRIFLREDDKDGQGNIVRKPRDVESYINDAEFNATEEEKEKYLISESDLVKRMSNNILDNKDKVRIELNDDAQDIMDSRVTPYDLKALFNKSKSIAYETVLKRNPAIKAALDMLKEEMKAEMYKLNPNAFSVWKDKVNEDEENKLQAIAEKALPTFKKFAITEPNTEIGYANASPTSTDTDKYEMVNHPSHYNSSSVETIEKMRRIWGNDATALWCEMTAFKYRDRIGNKPDNSNDQEVGKIKWYENKAKELRNQ